MKPTPEQRWTEQDYRDAGVSRLSVRLPYKVKRRIERLAAHEGLTLGKLLENWVERAEQELEGIKAQTR